MSQIRVLLGQNLNVDNDGLQIGGVLRFNDTNVRIGDNTTGANITTGAHNTFIGAYAGNAVTTGGRNNYFGYYAGGKNTTGSDNNFFGMYAGQCTTRSRNNFFGMYSGQNNQGDDNNFLGYQAGQNNTTGFHNNFIGYQSGRNNAGGDGNNFLGCATGRCNTTGAYNNFFGALSGAYNQSGSYNNFLGFRAGLINETGSHNNFLGRQAGENNTTGSNNTFIGFCGGYCNTTGSNNTFFGPNAGRSNTTGNYNSFFGSHTGISTSASNKIIIGRGYTNLNRFDSPNTTSDTQLAIGVRTSADPANYWIVGNENFNVGFGVNDPQTKVAIGGVLGFGASTDNIKIGDNATAQYISNFANISLGRSAGRGRNNSISSGSAAFTITSSTAIGGFAVFTDIYPTGGSGTNAIVRVTRNSSGVVTSVSTDTNDLSEGYQVGDVLTINGSNVGGVTGVDDITVTIASVDASQVAVDENIFIGSYAGRNISTGSDNNIFIGQCAGFYSTYAIRNVYIGQNAGLPNTKGIENTAIGHGAGNNWSGGYAQGNGNTFLGFYAGSTYDGFGNTAIGYQTGTDNSTGDYNAFLGSGSGANNTTGSCNSFTGNYSGASNTTGVLNTANGYLAGVANNIGSNNTFLGACAGASNTSGANNILIGWRSGTTNGVCNVTTESNYIVMGNNAHTCALIQVGWTTVSDTRDKCIYGNVKHGRGFLQNITPIEYAFKDRETGCLTDPEGKRRYGFSAQNILEAEGTDNPVIVSNDNPEKLQITSDYLIPVLVNAVNELSEEIDKLRSEINQLKSST